MVDYYSCNNKAISAQLSEVGPGTELGNKNKMRYIYDEIHVLIFFFLTILVPFSLVRGIQYPAPVTAGFPPIKHIFRR